MGKNAPRLVELNENVATIRIAMDAGKELTPLQQQIMKAWEEQHPGSGRVSQFMMRPWLRGEEIVFRDKSFSNLEKLLQSRVAKESAKKASGAA